MRTPPRSRLRPAGRSMMHSTPTSYGRSPSARSRPTPPADGNCCSSAFSACWRRCGSFVFTAAFPFFNNVDEQYHFDLVCRYSHGDVPRGLEPCSAEAASVDRPLRQPGIRPATSGFPAEKMRSAGVGLVRRRCGPRLFRQRKERVAAARESRGRAAAVLLRGGRPLVRPGKTGRLRGRKLLYWTRFFNVPLYMLLVWLSYRLAKELVPASRFVYLGVPCVLVFLPQDIFYGLNNDVLSAPLVTLSLYLLVRLYRTEAPRPGLALGAGLAAAAAVLTKFTNAPILAIVGSSGVPQSSGCRGGRTVAQATRARGAVADGDRHPDRMLAGEELRGFGRSDGICRCEAASWTGHPNPRAISEPSDLHAPGLPALLERLDNDFLARR